MDVTIHTAANGSVIDIEYYQYEPSAGAAWTFVVLFGLATVFHVVLLFIIRAWYFIPLIIGGVCETFGYFGRAWSHREPNSIKPWVTQELLILCAPPLVAATVYMILSRLVRALQAEPHSMIRPARITFIFVFNDVVTLLTQIAGAGVQVTGDQHVMNIGKKAVIAGLMIGIFVFALFILLTSKVHVRLKKHSTPVLKQNPHLRWKRYMWMLYIVSVAIMARNVVRIVHFAEGSEGWVSRHEAMIYVFDAFLMFLVLAVLIVLHPQVIIRRTRRLAEEVER